MINGRETFFMSNRIVRRNELRAVVGISPSSVDRLVAAGRFPKKRRWSEGITGWLASELEQWVEQNGKVVQ
jgi:predicted DNA-binding transcriptional regulator AlpA